MSSNQHNAAPGDSYGVRASMESDAGEQDSLLPTSATNNNAASEPRSFLQRVKHGLSNVVAPLAEPETLRPLERALLILTLVLFLLASIFVGLFAGAQHKLHHDTPGWGQPLPPGTGQPPETPGDGNTPNGPGHSEPPSSGSDGICFTRECVLTASDILRGIDESVDPCVDFYQFATGGWLKDHPIPADAGLFGAGQFVAANNAKIIEGLLQDKKAVKKQPDQWDQKSVTMLKGWYEGCTNSESQNRLGNAPLMEVLKEINDHFSKEKEAGKHLLFTEQRNPLPPNMPPGRSPRPHRPSDPPAPLPPAPGGRSSRQARLTRALAWQHSRGLPALFEFAVDGDAGKDPNLGTPTFYASGLGFPDKEYYDDKVELDFYKDTVKQAFLAVRAELRKAEKDDEEEVEEDDDIEVSRKKKQKKGAKLPKKSTFISLAHAVVEFEQALADITPDGGDSDPITSYNPSNMTVLSYDLRSIDWPTYFSALTVRPPKTIIISEPTYVRRLDSLISRTRDEVLEAYFFWTAIRTLGLNLGPSATLRKPADRLDRRSKGVEEDAEEDRSTTCLSSLNEALGFMAGRFFVREAFSAEAKSKAEGIIEGIIDAFKTRLPELDWLDSKTRSYAEKKADAVRIKVGYPESYPVTTDSKVIYEFYNDLKINASDHFGNVLRSQTRLSRRMWSYTDRRLNEGRWDMFPAEVNAYYNPPANEIVFPAGLLQPPYFSLSWPDYMQFGAFGTTAGHELSHAFDPAGRLYDKDGYLRDWWTKNTTVEFNRRKDCILEQYGNYSISDGKGGKLPLNVKLSIGEDVADGGGIEQSFRAWKTSLKRDTDEVRARNARLPGVNYTRDQLFFIAYGLAWGRNIRTEEAIRRLRTDEHSPTRYRVIGPLSNSEDFATAFGCKKGVDPMARSDNERCEIW